MTDQTIRAILAGHGPGPQSGPARGPDRRRLTPVEEEILAAVGLEPLESRRKASPRYRSLLTALRQADAARAL